MKKLTASALALLAFVAAVPQEAPGDSWGDLMQGNALPQKWPYGLEGIHACHLPPASGNQYGRVVFWGHGVTEPIGSKSTQAYVWDTAPGHAVANFINQAGSETTLPDPNMKLTAINFFCAGHTGDKDGNVFVVGGEEEDHSGHGDNSDGKVYVLDAVLATTGFDGARQMVFLRCPAFRWQLVGGCRK